MIFGIGTDIVEVSRLKKWVNNQSAIDRYFNKEEQKTFTNEQAACEHYAARFAAKEAFGKALGTGISGFALKDVFIIKNELGKPEVAVTNSAKECLEKYCGECKIHVSLSHEKAYAVATLIIEK